MASSNIANIEISTGAGYVFTNAADNDMVLYQTNSNNKILLGAMSNVNPNMIITPSNITLNVQGNTSNSAVKINANNNATNVATFLGSGKVGIGTETPSTTLDVAGDINFTGNLTKSGTAFSSGMAAQSNQFAVTSSTPAYGYSAGTVTVPTVSVSTLTSPSMYLGTVNLGAYGSTSLTNGSTISLNISHNIGDSNYIAYFCPEGGSNLSVTLTSKGVNSMTTAVKNISGGPLANPSFNYMLMTGTRTTSNVPLANKVTLAYSTCNLTVYSGASSTSSVKSIAGAATDPQGYAVTYSNLTNPSSQYTVSGSNFTITHAKTNRTNAVTVLATNTYNTDPTGQTITYNVTESNLAALSFTNSFTSNMATSNVTSLTYTLPATDQGLALTYSVTNNGGTTASVSGNVLTYSSKAATGTYTIALSGGLASSIMTEAALASRVFNFTANETYTNLFTTHTFTTAGVSGKNGPTLAQCKTAYASATWAQNSANFNMTTQGIQRWTVPKTGVYSFTVAGCRGSGRNFNLYGRGIQFTKNSPSLTAGQIINIVCGQYWEGSGNGGGGGGGGSFVWKDDGTLLFAAGGGGGGGSAAPQGSDASWWNIGSSGNSDGSGGTGSGGTNTAGGGGGQGTDVSWTKYGGTYAGTSGSSSVGGNGGSANNASDRGGGGGGGGFSTSGTFVGGVGGTSFDGNPGRDGGFGGGGAGGGGTNSITVGAGGGGGGYGGGGGGLGNYSGGGGGSYCYNEGPITGTSYNDGIGFVTVTFVA
jgi:hypothetical protein